MPPLNGIKQVLISRHLPCLHLSIWVIWWTVQVKCVSPLLKRLLRLVLEGLGPLSLQIWDKSEELQSWFQSMVLCLHIKRADSKEFWRKIVVAPLSLTFYSGGRQNFHPSNNTIISILQDLFSFFFFPFVVTNLLLIIVISTWSQILFTPASALAS